MTTLLTREEVAALLLEADDIAQRMNEKGVQSRKAVSVLPRGTLNCGELLRLNRGLRMMAWQMFPELADPEGMEAVIRNAVVAGAGGAMN